MILKDIDIAILKNIDIKKAVLENIDINFGIDRKSLRYIDINTDIDIMEQSRCKI